MTTLETLNIPTDLLPGSTFACGPSQSHPALRETPLFKTKFERSHRSPDITKGGLIRETAENIRKLLSIPDDYIIIQMAGGATASFDVVNWNLALDSVSGFAFGSFSKLWAKKSAGGLPDNVSKNFLAVKENEIFPEGDPDLNASLILLTPNETSMGVQVPNRILESIWGKKSENTLVAWDATSCIGGRNLPTAHYDAMFFSYVKCFGGGSGTSCLVLSPKAVERAKEVRAKRNIPYFINLDEIVTRARDKHQTLNTPSIVNIWLANEASKIMLANGGVPNMVKKVDAHAAVLFKWVEKTDWLDFFVKDEEFRSRVTPTFLVDENKIDAVLISKALAGTGLENLQDGIKKYSAMEGNAIRIACFPFVDFNGTTEFEKLTQAVDYVVKELTR